jgi:hypothetical protein
VIRPEVRVMSVTARTVQVRDVMLVGGQSRMVTGIRAVHGGRQLHLDTGELLTIRFGREYTVARPDPAVRWEGGR